jgi:zinc protease
MLALAAATAAACGPIAKPTGPTSMPVHEVRLANGIQIVLVPDTSATLATILVRYHVGAVDDPLHEEGVAHLVAHLMSAQHAGATSIATQLERIAIDLDIEPRATATDFSERFAPEHLDAVLASRRRA